MTSDSESTARAEAGPSSILTRSPDQAPKRTTVQHQQLPPRPKLTPSYPSAHVLTRPSSPHDDDEGNQAQYLPFSLSGLPPLSSIAAGESDDWVSVIKAPAHAPMQSWLNVMQSLIRHPERTSSNILRADVDTPTRADEAVPEEGATKRGWTKQWTIRRVLIPRRPNLDWRMEQDCSLFYRYSSENRTDEDHEDEEDVVQEAVIVYTPLIGDVSHAKMDLSHLGPSTSSPSSPLRGEVPPSEAFIPFYHPKVRALAFHFYPLPHAPSVEGEPFGTLAISLIPFPTDPCPGIYSPTHRLTRVAHSLLTTLHMHTWGHLHDYTKRVHHDTILPRRLYQDIYLQLKLKYARELIAGWVEATDAKKHVFEEMGIAAFLIGLWRLQYGGEAMEEEKQEEEARKRVKFVDVGCGNGLLTYILHREGWKGVGVDLRARKSWPGFVGQGAVLREWTFHPGSLLQSPAPSTSDEWNGAWLLGNHADQLTPWLPVLATHHNAAGFINLPCCYYALDGTRDFPLTFKRDVSRNEQYLAYVAALHTRFGWKVELDPLRIPSTKNWCFVGRKSEPNRAEDHTLLSQRVREAVQESLRTGWPTDNPTP